MSDVVRPLNLKDHARWLELWAEYQIFYAVTIPPAATAATWQRIHGATGAAGAADARRIHGLGACANDGALVGLVHFLFHADTWSAAPACYLQDLYVDPTARGRGHARRLIQAVAAAAKDAGASPPYWLTHHTNAAARTLYDRIGKNHGFIHYAYHNPDA